MSKQRFVKDSFWTDSYIESLTPDEKLIFLYLLTNPLNNVAGMYEIRIKRIGFETGYDMEVIENVLCRFERDAKVLREGHFLVLVNHVKNQANNPSIIQGCVRIFDELSHDNKQAVTGWVQAGLLNLTLLNLTLPNLTDKSEGVDSSESTKVKSVMVNDMSTYNPLGAEVIKLFETVDPKNKTYYGNKTQRGACDFLITEYGLAEIEKRTNVLPKTNGMPFFPNITTPCQLRDKWVQLDNAINRSRAEQQTKSDNVIW
jgi:hypothetical protein